jgi:phosphatidylserine/phosphatidylglycerophosphate/cardiolipin synthase-like enzyme
MAGIRKSGSEHATRSLKKIVSIKPENPDGLDTIQAFHTSGETRLVTNHIHYQEVLQRICTAKSSIKIMTANFKRFNLKPTDNQGDKYFDGTPFIKYLMAKAVLGVSVQIICSMPSLSFSNEWKEYYQQMMKPGLFDYQYCDRNHAKIFIIDDKLAYVGSANVTPAGVGQGIFTPGNIEAGLLTENPEIISSVKELFSMVWEGRFCKNCHRAEECKKAAK